MNKNELFDLMIPSDRRLDFVVDKAYTDPDIIAHLIKGVQCDNVRIRYGCFNTLVKISGKSPGVLYPHFDVFEEYLNSDNNVFKMGGIKIISQLSKVDQHNKFDRIFDKYYTFITDRSMTTAANVCAGSPVIARSKPYLTNKIINYLLKVDDTEYKTPACKKILIGKVITAFEKIFQKTSPHPGVLTFVQKYCNSNESKLRKKAQKFIKIHNIEPSLTDIGNQ